jgi:hypothetical protein
MPQTARKLIDFAFNHKKKVLTLLVTLCVALWRACS